jgi:hypothetical protein
MKHWRLRIRRSILLRHYFRLTMATRMGIPKQGETASGVYADSRRPSCLAGGQSSTKTDRRRPDVEMPAAGRDSRYSNSPLPGGSRPLQDVELLVWIRKHGILALGDGTHLPDAVASCASRRAIREYRSPVFLRVGLLQGCFQDWKNHHERP